MLLLLNTVVKVVTIVTVLMVTRGGSTTATSNQPLKSGDTSLQLLLRTLMTHVYPIGSVLRNINPSTTRWKVMSHCSDGYELLASYGGVPESETFICYFSVAHEYLKPASAISSRPNLRVVQLPTLTAIRRP